VNRDKLSCKHYVKSLLSKQPWLSYLELAVNVKLLLAIEILNTLKSMLIIAELRHHGIAKVSKYAVQEALDHLRQLYC